MEKQIDNDNQIDEFEKFDWNNHYSFSPISICWLKYTHNPRRSTPPPNKYFLFVVLFLLFVLIFVL